MVCYPRIVHHLCFYHDYLWAMVTHVLIPIAYHKGEEWNIRESVINEESPIILESVVIGTNRFLSECLVSALVIFTMQPKLLHVFNTLLEGSCLLIDTALPDVAVEVSCYHRRHFLDMFRICLQSLQ